MSIIRQPKNSPIISIKSQKCTSLLLLQQLKHDIEKARPNLLVKHLQLVLPLSIFLH